MRPEDLDKTISDIRNEAIDPAIIGHAAERVWARIGAVEAIRGCADFQALIPDYRAGKLPEDRALLVHDHTRECIACRKALDAAAGKVPELHVVPKRRSFSRWFALPAVRWPVAAAVTFTIGLTGWSLYENYGPVPAGDAVVKSSTGPLYFVTGGVSRPAATGEKLPAGAEARTGQKSDAFLSLPDGSLLELRESSGVSVTRTGTKDVTVNLSRGSVIIKAAKRSSGHLYVTTKDCRVAVTGTVFSVSSGLKGSRVAVVEGEVRVAQAGQERVLRPGDQHATNPSIAPVRVEEEISWSRNVDQHIALLREFSALGKKLEELRMPQTRYSSRLLPLVPRNTAIYASIPNLGATLSEAHAIFRQRVQESPVLRQWWEEKMEGRNAGPVIEQTIEKIRKLSEHLGDEIVLAAALDDKGDPGEPVFLAELRGSGFREAVERELAGTNSGLRIFDRAGERIEPAQPGRRHDPLILIRPNVVALSPDASALTRVATSLDGASADNFAGTPFYARITEAYRDGAGMLFSADLEKLTAKIDSRRKPGDIPEIGKLKHIIVERKETDGRPETRAVLSFLNGRQGLSSWLGRPSAMGVLEFVSPDASFVSAFALTNPASIVDELFAWQEASNPSFRQGLAQIESALGVNIRNDLAAPLGSEVVFAIDGPGLPTQAWKLVFEVQDTARLQRSLATVIEAGSRMAALFGKPTVQLTSQVAGGRTYYTVTTSQPELPEIHYVFVDGYLVAAAGRTQLDRTLQQRETRYTLARSTNFAALLPRDRQTNLSAVVYFNVGSTVAPVVEALSSAGSALSADQRRALAGLAAEIKPTLIAAYGEEDRITVATTASLPGLSLTSLAGAGGPGGFVQAFGRKSVGTARRTRSY